jgi:hypothetical protein
MVTWQQHSGPTTNQMRLWDPRQHPARNFGNPPDHPQRRYGGSPNALEPGFLKKENPPLPSLRTPRGRVGPPDGSCAALTGVRALPRVGSNHHREREQQPRAHAMRPTDSPRESRPSIPTSAARSITSERISPTAENRLEADTPANLRAIRSKSRDAHVRARRHPVTAARSSPPPGPTSARHRPRATGPYSVVIP